MDLNLETIKRYLNISSDYTEDDSMLQRLLDEAIGYVKSYTGLPDLVYKELELAVMQIVSSTYNNRDYESVDKLNISGFAKSILDMHSQNLV